MILRKSTDEDEFEIQFQIVPGVADHRRRLPLFQLRYASSIRYPSARSLFFLIRNGILLCLIW